MLVRVEGEDLMSRIPGQASGVDDYAKARCAAIKRDGERCTGGWRTAVPCMFEWDPIAGRGTDAPYVVLCWRHSARWWDRKNGGPRLRVVDGWLGPYNEHSYGSAVWDAPDGWHPAKWWWSRRGECRFGDLKSRRDAR